MHAETLRVGRLKTTVCRMFRCPPSLALPAPARPAHRRSRSFSKVLKRLSGTTPPPRLAALRWASQGGLSSGARVSERRRRPQAASLPVVIGVGSHPFPFRTRKLSLLPPMVLHGKLCGRVGRCRHYLESPNVTRRSGFFFLRTLFPRQALPAGQSHCTSHARPFHPGYPRRRAGAR
jgi:hypothetical protein